MSQINRRQFLLAAWALLLAAPPTALGQITGRILRIAFLDDASEQSRREALKAFAGRLAEFGFAEGKNLIIDARYAPGALERLPALAEELVALKPDIMVTTDTPTTRAAMRATSSIPIVFIASGDPVGGGLVSSLSRPGGNVTGSMILTAEYRAKWLELLRQIAPKAKRVGYLADFLNPLALRGFEQLQEVARSFNVTILD